MSYETGARNGIDYSITGRSGRWSLSLRCDCLLGPHWHFVGVYKTKAEARAAVAL